MTTTTGEGVLNLLELYPAHLAINGDMGNTLVLTERARLAGVEVVVHRHDPGDLLPERIDLITMGSGPASAVAVVAADLPAIATRIRSAVEDGAPALFVGAGFHLAGEEITGIGEGTLAGLGVFRQTTDAAAPRQVTASFEVDTRLGRLVGIENHGSFTRLRGDQAPFGRALTGRGNGPGHDEGARTAEAIGTHLHGPVLAMNPVLADHMLEAAAARAGLAYRTGEEHLRLDELARATRDLLADRDDAPDVA